MAVNFWCVSIITPRSPSITQIRWRRTRFVIHKRIGAPILFLFSFWLFAARSLKRETSSTGLVISFSWTQQRFKLKTERLEIFKYINDGLFDWPILQSYFERWTQNLSNKMSVGAPGSGVFPCSVILKCGTYIISKTRFHILWGTGLFTNATSPWNFSVTCFTYLGFRSRGNWDSGCTGSIFGEKDFRGRIEIGHPELVLMTTIWRHSM